MAEEATAPKGDAVKPVAHPLPRHDRRGFADEHEKRDLERIVRIVNIAKDAAADA